MYLLIFCYYLHFAQCTISVVHVREHRTLFVILMCKHFNEYFRCDVLTKRSLELAVPLDATGKKVNRDVDIHLANFIVSVPVCTISARLSSIVNI